MALRREILDAIRSGSFDEFVRLVTPEDAVAEYEGKVDIFGTYLHFCAQRSRLEMASHLIKLGADVNHRAGVWKAMPMTYAADLGDVEMVKLLRNYGADFDLHEDERINPLFMAIKEGHISVVNYFLEAGLDPHVVYRVDRGKLRNALSLAQEIGQQEIAKLLQSYGCRAPNEGVDEPVWELPREEWSEESPVYDQIVEYMQERFGPVDALGMQELLPVVDDMSVTINVIPPNDEHPFLVLFTNGMSDRPMKVPAGQEAWHYAELVMHLPPDWPHPRDAGDSEWLWPVQCLRRLAYHPHLHDTWYGPPAAIVSNADPPEPLGPNTQQTCLLLVPRFANLQMPLLLEDGRMVNLFTVVPLHTEEREFELKHGMQAFLNRFVEHKVPMTVDVQRASFG